MVEQSALWGKLHRSVEFRSVGFVGRLSMLYVLLQEKWKQPKEINLGVKVHIQATASSETILTANRQSKEEKTGYLKCGGR